MYNGLETFAINMQQEKAPEFGKKFGGFFY